MEKKVTLVDSYTSVEFHLHDGEKIDRYLNEKDRTIYISMLTTNRRHQRFNGVLKKVSWQNDTRAGLTITKYGKVRYWSAYTKGKKQCFVHGDFVGITCLAGNKEVYDAVNALFTRCEVEMPNDLKERIVKNYNRHVEYALLKAEADEYKALTLEEKHTYWQEQGLMDENKDGVLLWKCVDKHKKGVLGYPYDLGITFTTRDGMACAGPWGAVKEYGHEDLYILALRVKRWEDVEGRKGVFYALKGTPVAQYRITGKTQTGFEPRFMEGIDEMALLTGVPTKEDTGPSVEHHEGCDCHVCTPSPFV